MPHVAVPDIHVGDRVIIRGDFTGVVKWVGQLDVDIVNSPYYVGVNLDEPGV